MLTSQLLKLVSLQSMRVALTLRGSLAATTADGAVIEMTARQARIFIVNISQVEAENTSAEFITITMGSIS